MLVPVMLMTLTLPLPHTHDVDTIDSTITTYTQTLDTTDRVLLTFVRADTADTTWSL